MKKIHIFFISIILLGLSSCQKEDSLSDESVIYNTELHKGELDAWIKKNFTDPYNIEIKWKWDDTEVDNKYTLIPPKEEKTYFFLKTLLEIWIKPYEEEAGVDFIKQFVPKLFILSGTPQINEDKTFTLGLAEGGKKVTIFNINNFGQEPDFADPEFKEITDIDERIKASITKSFHVLHHEFAHILHQKILYPEEFKAICKGKYTGAWYNVSDIDAKSQGFITPYSMLNEDEDWVEIVATIFTKVKYSNEPKEFVIPVKDNYGFLATAVDEVTKETYIPAVKVPMTEFDHYIYMLGITTKGIGENMTYVQDYKTIYGVNLLMKKFGIISKYYEQNWNISLGLLQKKIELAVNKLDIYNVYDKENL